MCLCAIKCDLPTRSPDIITTICLLIAGGTKELGRRFVPARHPAEDVGVGPRVRRRKHRQLGRCRRQHCVTRAAQVLNAILQNQTSHSASTLHICGERKEVFFCAET